MFTEMLTQKSLSNHCLFIHQNAYVGSQNITMRDYFILQQFCDYYNPSNPVTLIYSMKGFGELILQYIDTLTLESKFQNTHIFHVVLNL